MRLARVVVVVIMVVVVVVVVVTRGLYSSTAAAAVAAVHLAASLALFPPVAAADLLAAPGNRGTCSAARHCFLTFSLLSHERYRISRRDGSVAPSLPIARGHKLPASYRSYRNYVLSRARGGDFAPSRDARFVTASNNGDARRLFYLLTTRCDWKRYTIEIDLHRGI